MRIMASKIRVYGEAQNRTALGIIHAFMQLNPTATIEDLRKAFPDTIATDKGVAEIFVDSGFEDKGEHYFTAADELVETADGKKVAVVKLWTKPSYENLKKRAADYDIEVTEFEQQQQVGKKGSYHLEYVNGYDPAAVTVGEIEEGLEEGKKARGCLNWFWLLLLAVAILLLVVLLVKGCKKDEVMTYQPTEVSSAVVDGNGASASGTDAAAMSGDALAGTDASAIANGAATAQSTGNSGACTTASKEAVAQIENLQKQFDEVEYPVGEYRLNSTAKSILDKVAKLMKDNPGMKITVNGYASREGNSDANQILSDKRAATVVGYLKDKGIASDRLKAVGLNSSNPISQDLAPNRRIDFVVE